MVGNEFLYFLHMYLSCMLQTPNLEIVLSEEVLPKAILFASFFT